MRKLFPLQPRSVHRGYVKTSDGWRYVNSNLHSRINMRVGLWKGGFDVNGKFIVWGEK